MYVFENPNPAANRTDDCFLRTLGILTGEPWLSVYWKLCALGANMYMLPNAKPVVKAFLLRNGYRAQSLPDTCPACYTVRDFAREHPHGRYLLTSGDHAVAVIEGSYYDSWDSGDEVPVYVWAKEEE